MANKRIDCYREELSVFRAETAEGEAYKVPHMGWNRLNCQRVRYLLNKLEEDYVYFVHSYYVDTDDQAIITGESRLS